MNKLFFATLFIALLGTVHLTAQSYQVINIHGEAYAVQNDNGKEKYAKITLGPLLECDQIIVKEKSKLRILKDEKAYIDIDAAARYTLADMTFSPLKAKSPLEKFTKYFSYFFSGHASSESKSSYQNSVYAISRGMQPRPSLDFPVEGMLAIPESPLTFRWTHDCADCQYVLNIYDTENQSMIFGATSSSKEITLEKPTAFLKPGSQYYWTVSISGVDMEYQRNVFEATSYSDYETFLSNAKADLSGVYDDLSVVAQTVYMLQWLAEQDMINYAIYYGQQRCSEHPDDIQLANIVDRLWYDYLLYQQ